MKKEFKAPIVETKELNTVNSVMDSVLTISGNVPSKLTVIDDNATNADYKQWKKASE